MKESPRPTADELDMKRCVFYMDLLDSPLFPKFIRYIIQFGGQVACFLDKNVTHVVTDKAKMVVETYPKVEEWSITIWSVEEFAASIMRHMEHKAATAPAGSAARAMPSPTLLRVVGAKRKDLQQCLQEEKKSRAFRSLPATGAATGSGSIFTSAQTKANTAAVIKVLLALFPQSSAAPAGERVAFREFYFPFVAISEPCAAFSPSYKEYAPSSGAAGRYPQLNWDREHTGSPFLPTTAAKRAPKPEVVYAKPTTSGMLTRSKAAARKSTTISVAAVTGPRASNTLINQPTESQQRETIVPQPAFVAVEEDGDAGPESEARPGEDGAAHECVDEDKENIVDDSLEEEDAELAVVQSVALVNPLLNTAATLAGSGNPQRKPAPARPRPGYCECCLEKYNELEKHVKSIGHRQFALQDANYSSIDSLLVFMERPKVAPDWASAFQAPKSTAASNEMLPPMSPVSAASLTTAVANSSEHVATARNYTLRKRANQNEAIRQLNLHTSLGPTDSEMALACNSSPSLKRRRSNQCSQIAL